MSMEWAVASPGDESALPVMVCLSLCLVDFVFGDFSSFCLRVSDSIANGHNQRSVKYYEVGALMRTDIHVRRPMYFLRRHCRFGSCAAFCFSSVFLFCILPVRKWLTKCPHAHIWGPFC